MKKEEIIPNTIYFTTNFETLIEVIKKLDEVKNNDLPKEDFVKRLTAYITQGSGMVLVSFNEKKELNGCVVISRHLDKKGYFLWLDFRWIDDNYKELMNKFYNEVIGLCKEWGIERIQGRANRCFRVVEKYYGAYEIGRIFELKVKEAVMKNGYKK